MFKIINLFIGGQSDSLQDLAELLKRMEGNFMNKNFKVDAEAQRLLDMIYAPMYTKILFAAIELDVFSELEKAKMHTEVAEKLDLNPENTKCLLDALTGMDLLEKEKGFYKNTGLASKYLVLGCELYLGDHLRGYNITAGFNEIDVAKLVKEGPNDENTSKMGLEAYSMFSDLTEMMKSLQRGGRAREIADLVSELPEFPGFEKMLDMGGGPGLIGMAVVRKHPKMNGVIFDVHEVGRVARKLIKENEMKDRMKVMTGDYLKDSIGQEYDFILAIGTLNFAKHEMDTIIKKIYKALNPKGVFMCISDGLTHEETRPKEMVAAWLPSLLKGFNFSLKQGEVSDAVLRNGFRSVYKQTVNMLTGPMDVDVARK